MPSSTDELMIIALADTADDQTTNKALQWVKDNSGTILSSSTGHDEQFKLGYFLTMTSTFRKIDIKMEDVFKKIGARMGNLEKIVDNVEKSIPDGGVCLVVFGKYFAMRNQPLTLSLADEVMWVGLTQLMTSSDQQSTVDQTRLLA
ncbi:hypothetical protein LIER_32066 [Lithospermum erythrorhizon]|uniref:Uncharacterized protein n=1 Tax=Lithospermum erythrorhizon TaxID=34254 RepID=A0AAV3RUL8_LITER